MQSLLRKASPKLTIPFPLHEGDQADKAGYQCIFKINESLAMEDISLLLFIIIH